MLWALGPSPSFRLLHHETDRVETEPVRRLMHRTREMAGERPSKMACYPRCTRVETRNAGGLRC